MEETQDPATASIPYPELSRRERDVIILVTQGLDNREVANALVIGVKTYDTHRASAMRKLGVKNVAQLMLLAFRRGYLPTPVVG